MRSSAISHASNLIIGRALITRLQVHVKVEDAVDKRMMVSWSGQNTHTSKRAAPNLSSEPLNTKQHSYVIEIQPSEVGLISLHIYTCRSTWQLSSGTMLLGQAKVSFIYIYIHTYIYTCRYGNRRQV